MLSCNNSLVINSDLSGRNSPSTADSVHERIDAAEDTRGDHDGTLAAWLSAVTGEQRAG